MKIVAVILASGIGERTGSYLPKQFIKINGKKVIDYSIDTFKKAGFDIIVTVPPGYKNKFIERKDIYIVEGEKDRIDTVKKTFSKLIELEADYVIYHDSARPLIPLELIESIKKNIKDGKEAMITSAKITDSLLSIEDMELKNRDSYRLIQTPEVFKVKNIIEAYRNQTINPTLIAQPLLETKTVHLLETDIFNFKITYKEDIRLIEKLLTNDSDPLKPCKEIDLVHKKICVIGGTGGIGKEIIKQLEAFNCEIYSPTRKELNLCQNNLDFDNKKFDYLIHTAGICYNDQEADIDKTQELITVNFLSVYNILKNAKKIINTGGAIIVIGSSSSTEGRTGFGLYSASKAAVNSIVQAYKKPLEEIGIRVNSLCPTKTNTDLVKKTITEEDEEYLLTPEYVASIAIRTLEIKETGKIWYLYKGLDKGETTCH